MHLAGFMVKGGKGIPSGRISRGKFKEIGCPWPVLSAVTAGFSGTLMSGEQ